MRTALVLAILFAFSPTARADDDATAQAVLDAVTRQDAAAFLKLAPRPFFLGDIWFASAPCRKQFQRFSMLGPADQPAFLACLATLELSISTTRTRSGIENARLTYEPGGEVVVRRRNGQIEGISMPVSDAHDPTAVPITQDALTAHRGNVADIEPEPRIRDEIVRSPNAVAFAQLTACIDTAGKLETATVTRYSRNYKGYQDAVVAAMKTWTFTPFQRHGQAVRVCGPQLIAYPPDRWQLTLPPPPPPPPTPPPPPPPATA